MFRSVILAALAALPFLAEATTTWNQVKIGGGGGFIPGIVFSPKTKGVAFARADIGGLYRLNSDDSWTPLLDWVGNGNWHDWGVDALALDPTNAAKVYVAVGMYTNEWDPNNGSILASSDSGNTWTTYALPFKVGGNMPGRGIGERLAVDPNLPTTLYFGARSGHGLYKSTNSGATWTNVANFPSAGTYFQDSSSTYTSDPVGLAWVTFDASTGTSGSATKRIFVGVVNVNTTSIYWSNDAGATWAAVPGQPMVNNIPHKGVISPTEKCLYVTFNNNAGPYDGTVGSVGKFNITSQTWKDITPVAAPYFGFGGLAVDLQKPGTIMVATVNSWWPDGNIYRSIDGGTTWSPLWDWVSYPTLKRYYTYDVSLAPWIGLVSPTVTDVTSTTGGTTQIGWMMEALVIDPFDSNHWLYGTGLTIYGGHDLLNWDSAHSVTLKSLADGIEEDAVIGLISPTSGPNLLSVVGDNGGYAHTSLTTAPTTQFQPNYGTTTDIDWAGQKPTNIVRVGDTSSTTVIQVALSTDSGATWNYDYGAPFSAYGGKIALSATGDIVLWATGSGQGVLVSQYTNAFKSVSSLPSSGTVIASDKILDANFYAANANKFYASTNNGVSFTASAGTLGAATVANAIKVNWLTSGDVWVSTDVGLFHTTNSGASFTTIAGFGATWSIALGAPKTTGGYPSVFAAGTFSGTVGYYRSDDQGVSWVRLDDATHGFGSAASNVISGDTRVWGRVYVGTNGRGIFYGNDNGSGTATSVTTTKASTTATTPTTTSSAKPTTTTAVTTTTKASTTTTTKASTTAIITTTKASSTTTSKTTTTAASGATQTHYGQCGGIGYTGPTNCTPYTCVTSNPYYSQCL